MLAAPIRTLEIIQADNKPARADRQLSSTPWHPRMNRTRRTGVTVDSVPLPGWAFPKSSQLSDLLFARQRSHEKGRNPGSGLVDHEMVAGRVAASFGLET